MPFLNKKKFFFLAFLILSLSVFAIPFIASAQVTPSLGIEYGSSINLGTRDIREVVMSIAQVLLGFLGVVAILIVLYGGYLYMTSAGEQDKVTKAKKILINGVIGLVIIVSAFAIATFVINMLGLVTTPGTETCTNGENRACSNWGICARQQTCVNSQWQACALVNPACDPFGSDTFALTQTVPHDPPPAGANTPPIMNVVVQLTFSNNIAGNNTASPNLIPTVNGATIIQSDAQGNYNPSNAVQLVGHISSNPKRMELRPNNALPQYQCPGWGTTIDPTQYPNLACFPYTPPDDNPLNWYRVNVLTDQTLSFQDNAGHTVTCQASVPCQFDFRVGPLIDLEPPTVNLKEAEDHLSIIYPWNTNNINISNQDQFIFRADATDDAALGTVTFYEQENGYNLAGRIITANPPDYVGESENEWDTELLGYLPGQHYHIKSEVTDYAANSAQSTKQVTMYPAHCFNGSCDEGESCNTDPTKPVDCGVECPACDGDSCSNSQTACDPNNAVCSTDICIPANQPNECTCYPTPDINNISPIDGAPQTFVTITGTGFGANPGLVYFKNNDTGLLTPAPFPNTINPACTNNWSNTQVIVTVPNVSLPFSNSGYNIELRALNPFYPGIGNQYLIDTYGSGSGESVFTINDVNRPGLCLTTPNSGLVGVHFTLQGNNLGEATSQRSIQFGNPPNNFPASNYNFISSTQAAGDVPNINGGNTVILAIVDTLESNTLAFNVQTVTQGDDPFITNFTPTSGPTGQYVTIYGGNFGAYDANNSKVYFRGTNNQLVPVNFQDFPEECGTDFWHDDFIVVKVPEDPMLNSGSGPIKVIRADGAWVISANLFTYAQDDPLLPGVCSVLPQEGQVSDPVQVIGEYFETTNVNFSTQLLPNSPVLGQTGHADVFNVNVPNVESGEVLVQKGDQAHVGDVCTALNANTVCYPYNLYCQIPQGQTNGTCQYITSTGWPFVVNQTSGPVGGTFDYYDWQFLTCAACLVPQVLEDADCSEQLASPSPPNIGVGNTQAYVNSVLGARFNTNMADASFVYNLSGQTGTPTYIIQQCNGNPAVENLIFNSGDCLSFNYSSFFSGYPSYNNSTQEYVQVKSQNDFLPGYWYRIILTNGLYSQAEGYPLENNLNFDLDGNSEPDSYEWHFRTRLVADACTPNDVNVEPTYRREVWVNITPPNPIEKNQTINYNSCGVDSGVCAICPDTFKWGWTEGGLPPAMANNFTLSLLPPNDDSHVNIQADEFIRWTDLGLLNAEITQFLTPSGYQPATPPLLTGTGDFNIVPATPYLEFDNPCFINQGIITNWPSPTPFLNQNNVCLNAQVSARFVDSQGNPVAMDQTSFNTVTISLNGTPISATITYLIYTNNILNGFVLTPAAYLSANQTYTVSLAGVRSADGEPVAGITSWSFTTGNNICDFTSVLVYPGNNNMVVNEVDPNYSASGVAQCLLLTDPVGTYWDWRSEDISIATVIGDPAPNDDEATVTAGPTSNLFTFIRAKAMPMDIENTGNNGKVNVVTGPGEIQLLIDDHDPVSPPPVCLNALIRLEFSEPIGNSDVITNLNTAVVKCSDATCLPGQTAVVIGDWINIDDKIFEFFPEEYLDPTAYYRVMVVGGTAGVYALANPNRRIYESQCLQSNMLWNPTLANGSCYWIFNTGTELCAVDNIYLNVLGNTASTSSTIMEEEDEEWEALAYAENGNPLTNPMDDWEAQNTNIAELTPVLAYPLNTHFQRSIGHIDRTLFGTTTVSTDLFAKINATANQPAVSSNPGHLTVTPILQGPSVTETKPLDGDTGVCLNAMVSVKFDKHLDPTTVNSNNFKIDYNTATPPPASFVQDSVAVFEGHQMLSRNYNAYPSPNLNPNLEDFMIEAWIKTEPNLATQVLIFEKDWVIPGYFVEMGADGRIKATIRAYVGGPLVTKIFYSSSAVNNGQWHHVAVTFDRNGSGLVYIDGLPNGTPVSIAMFQNIGLINTGDPSIGGFNSGAEKFDGSIASVRFYKFGTSGLPANINNLISYNFYHPTEIASEFTAPNNFLHGDWEFNDSQNIGKDSTANGYDMNVWTDPGYQPLQLATENLPVTTQCSVVAYGPQAPNKKTPFISNFLARAMNNFVGKWFNKIFNKVIETAQAYSVSGYWCPLEGYGNWSLENSLLYSTVKFNLSQMLPSNNTLRVKVVGGQTGVKADNGWALENPNYPVSPNTPIDYVYTFETGETVCTLDHITVNTDVNLTSNGWLFTTPEDDEDDNVTDPADPDFDSVPDSDKAYFAHGYALDGQEIQRVPGIPPLGYDWTWGWSSANTAIALIKYSDNPNGYAIIGAENQSGESDITAAANFAPIYQTDPLSNNGLATVDLCFNPWPARDPGSIEITTYEDDVYNFSFRYCRDAGGPGVSDDLPAVDEDDFVIDTYLPTDPNADEKLKEYLIPVPTTGDVIGLKVFENAFHLSPQAWYQTNIENPGSPGSHDLVDGYEAIQDGRTTYVGATNVVLDFYTRGITLGPSETKLVKAKGWLAALWDDLLGQVKTAHGQQMGGYVATGLISGDQVFSNIFLLSYNQSAAPETMAIVNQLLEKLKFNINTTDEVKAKMVKDLERLAGLTGMAQALDNYQENHNGTYPVLSAGTFVPGISTSKWPSWNQTLGPEIGGGMAVDPINTFTACIDCTEPELLNGGFEEAPALDHWIAEANVNAVTTTNSQFIQEGENAAVVAAEQADKGLVSEVVSLISNTTYEISAWVYVESPNRAQLEFGNTLLGGNYGNEWFTPPDYTGWFQLKNRLISPSGATNFTSIQIRAFTGSAIFYVDNVVFQTAGGNCGYDPETCWNPEANNGQGAFACDGGSHIYAYKSLSPLNYELSAKMEAVSGSMWYPQNTATINYIDPHLDMTLGNVSVCDSLALSGYCGDHVVNYPTEACEPEIGMINYLCSISYNWYTPVTIGCNAVGSTAPQLACQWYNPLVAPPTNECNGMTAAQCCGGYCGDSAWNLSPAYRIDPDEECEKNMTTGGGWGHQNPVYAISEAVQYSCSSTCQDTGGWCGDNNYQADYEPCEKAMTTGGGWAHQDPALANSATMQYICSSTCQDNGGWCGDAFWSAAQQAYGEECDPGAISGAGWGHQNPAIAQNSSTQYLCSTVCEDNGGWCGDGTRQAITSIVEQCDTTSPSNPPHTSCSTSCAASCVTTPIPYLACNNGGIKYDADGCEVNRNTGQVQGPTSILNCGICNNNCTYTGINGHAICVYPTTPYCQIECNTGYHCQLGGGNICTNPLDTCVSTQVCGDGLINGTEECEPGPPPNLNGQSCQSIDPTFIGGLLSCDNCQFNTSACCSSATFNTKFTGDNDWYLYLNGAQIDYDSSSYAWQTIGETNSTLTPGVQNVIAFKTTDASGCYGTIGTFSCQPMFCHKICFHGDHAGEICDNNASLCSPGGGTCYSPTSPVLQSCTSNSSCDSTYNSDPANKPSTCLPNDYGYVTSVDNWLCKTYSGSPPANWNQIGFDPVLNGWTTPNTSSCSYAWGLSSSNYYWDHKVPGATTIWAGTSGGVSSYCRLMVDLTGASAPQTPINFSATNIYQTSVTLAWSPVVGSIPQPNYYILERDSGAGWTTVSSSIYATPPPVQYSDTGLTSNTDYYYRVKGCVSGGLCSGYAPDDNGLLVTTLAGAGGLGTIFITSSAGDADILTQADNLGFYTSYIEQSGVTAADFLCTYYSSQSGAVSNVEQGQWLAWISDDEIYAFGNTHDRFRFNGSRDLVLPNGTQVGTITGNGSQATINITNPNINISEFNTVIPAGIKVWTNTQTNGTVANPSIDCTNWGNNSLAIDGNYGIVNGGSGTWTYGSSQYEYCASSAPHLYCVFDYPLVTDEGTIFITSMDFTGDVRSAAMSGGPYNLNYSGNNGLEAADYACTQLANNAPGNLVKQGTWHAWLSSVPPFCDYLSYDDCDAINRFTNTNQVLRLTDGTIIANSLTDLLSNGTFKRINLDQEGNLTTPLDGHRFWTNTSPSGTAFGYNLDCEDWRTNNNSSSAMVGIEGLYGAPCNYFPSNHFDEWTECQSQLCSQSLKLLCIFDHN